VLGWVWPREPQAFALGRLPVWAIDHLDGTIHYGFPMMDDVPGFKLAHHAPGPATDPDRVARDPQPGDEETFRPILRTMIPSADGPLLSMKVCLYTNTPDGHFIIDHHAAHDNVTIACGFSGHGFKFASVVGEILADLAMDGSTKLPAQFLGLDRPLL
jgi:sarcosine oxidase